MGWTATHLSSSLMQHPDPDLTVPIGTRIRLSPSLRTRPRPDQHVEPHDGHWCVRAEGESAPSLVCPSRNEAFVWATEVAKRKQVKVLVHRTNGNVVASFDFTQTP